jgi:hypothetical protein
LGVVIYSYFSFCPYIVFKVFKAFGGSIPLV